MHFTNCYEYFKSMYMQPSLPSLRTLPLVLFQIAATTVVINLVCHKILALRSSCWIAVLTFSTSYAINDEIVIRFAKVDLTTRK